MSRNGIAGLAVVMSVAWAAACDSTAPPASVTVWDSAGVSIVTNQPGGGEGVPRWTLSSQPAVDIGSGANPEVSLFRVVDALPLGDGRVVVGMTAPPRVLLIDTSGSVAAAVGRQGDGPGEFVGVGSLIALEPDSLAVWDPERRRISIFTLDGVLRREVDMSDIAPISWIASPNALQLSARTNLLPSASASFVLFAIGMFGPGQGVRRVEAPSIRIGTDGGQLIRLGSFPGETTFMSNATGVAPYPLGADTYATTQDDELIVGIAESPEYQVYGPDGSLRRIVRWPEPDPIAEGPCLQEWNVFVEEFLSSIPPGEAQDIRDILEAMPQPEHLPAFGGLVGSDTKEAWIGPYYPGQLMLGVAYMGRMPVPEQEWLVFGSDGSVQAKVVTPAGFRPLTVVRGQVWGIHTDDLGVESVRAYDVLRS